MTSRAFTHLATVTASTKRPAAVAGGLRGNPATSIASLVCTPLDPVDAEIRERVGLGTPLEVLQTFVQGSLDIKEGDVLVVGTAEYQVRAVEDWTWPHDSSTYRRLILEELH